MARNVLAFLFILGFSNAYGSAQVENISPTDQDLALIAQPPQKHLHAPKAVKLNKKQRAGLRLLKESEQKKYLDLMIDDGFLNNALSRCQNEPGVPSTPTKSIKNSNSMHGRPGRPVPYTVLPSPAARKKFSREAVHIMNNYDLSISREEMLLNQQSMAARRLDYNNHILAQKIREIKETAEIKLMAGYTRQKLVEMRKKLGIYATEHTAQALENFVKTIDRSMNKFIIQDSLKDYFLNNLSASFVHFTASIPQRHAFQTLHFFINPFDIDPDFKDKYGRTNLMRLQLGLNPVTLNPYTNEIQSFEYHHVTQRVDSPILCLPKYLHTDSIHPFLDHASELDPVDRADFNLLKREFNTQLVHYFLENITLLNTLTGPHSAVPSANNGAPAYQPLCNIL